VAAVDRHAVNHAQAVVLPLIYLKITDDFNVGVDTIAFLAAGRLRRRGRQLSFASLTRSSPAEAARGGRLLFAAVRRPGVRARLPHLRGREHPVRIGGSPQHPWATASCPSSSRRSGRGFAISAHISGGNVGTVVVAVVGRRSSSCSAGAARRSCSAPGLAIAVAILLLIRERGTDRAAAVASGSVRTPTGRSPTTATCAGCT